MFQKYKKSIKIHQTMKPPKKIPNAPKLPIYFQILMSSYPKFQRKEMDRLKSAVIVIRREGFV